MDNISRGSLFLKVLGICVALGSWQTFAILSNNPLIPELQTICLKFLELARDGELAAHAKSSLLNGFAGLSIAFVVATMCGFLAARSWVFDSMLHPLVSLGYPVPKLALYPMVILILGLGGESRTAQVALECFFPLFVQSYAGAKAVRPHMEWLARNVDAGSWRLAKDVILPTALPFLFTGLRIAIPIMLIVTTVTEFIGDSHGLGFLIARSSAYFDTASAFAVVAVLGALGLLADRLVVYSRDRFVFWEKGTSL